MTSRAEFPLVTGLCYGCGMRVPVLKFIEDRLVCGDCLRRALADLDAQEGRAAAVPATPGLSFDASVANIALERMKYGMVFAERSSGTHDALPHALPRH